MERSLKQQQRNRLLTVFWSLLLIKCLSLDYLVIKYEVPINSAIYVWCLSLFMASVATLIKYRIEHSPQETQNNIEIHKLVWAFIFFIMIVLTGLCITDIAVKKEALLTISALLLAAGYFAQGILLRRLKHILICLGWILSAALLYQSSITNSLLVAAGSLGLLITSPYFSAYYTTRKRYKNKSDSPALAY